MALPAEGKLLLRDLIEKDGEKTFVRSIAAYQVLRDILISSNNETTYGTAVAIEVTTWLSL